MTEPQRLVWYLPRPACTKVNNAMQQLTSVTYQTSEQHGALLIQKKLMSFIEWIYPIDADPTVRNIA